MNTHGKVFYSCKSLTSFLPINRLIEKIAVIGSGFAGLTSSIELAALGYDVTLYEKNNQPGRARKLEIDGFTFDMGPSWYWMPDVFEKFFARHEKTRRLLF